jgi:hypothetical protein
MKNELTKTDKLLIDEALSYVFNQANPSDLAFTYEGIVRLAEIRVQIASETIIKGYSKNAYGDLAKVMADRFWNK